MRKQKNYSMTIWNWKIRDKLRCKIGELAKILLLYKETSTQRNDILEYNVINSTERDNLKNEIINSCGWT